MTTRTRVLVTRPEGAADTTIKKLHDMGFEPVHVPLLRVEHLMTDAPQGVFDGLILTSAQALTPAVTAWIAAHPEPKTVIVTGAATARAAGDIGLQQVENVEGGALDIVARLSRENRDGRRFLYPCAEVTAHDLPTLLRKANVTCMAWPVYRTVERDGLPALVGEELSAGTISSVLLYSPRTAQAFARLAPELPVNVQLLCLSEAVARAVGEIGHNRCRYPSKPTEKALLRLMTEPESGQRL